MENKEEQKENNEMKKEHEEKHTQEHNKEKELNEKLSKVKDELEDVKDRHTRLIAEFDNLKKRSAKERENLYGSIMGDVISSLLPVLDNLEKAVMAETKDEEYKKGIELVLKQFKDVLSANGVKEIEAVGQPFDPELHEAVSMIQDENLGEKITKEFFVDGVIFQITGGVVFALAIAFHNRTALFLIPLSLVIFFYGTKLSSDKKKSEVKRLEEEAKIKAESNKSRTNPESDSVAPLDPLQR